MSSLWTDLLFLHGHITDWRLMRRLSLKDTTPESAPPAQPAIEPQNQHFTQTHTSMLRLRLRLCLGIGSGELNKQ